MAAGVAWASQFAKLRAKKQVVDVYDGARYLVLAARLSGCNSSAAKWVGSVPLKTNTLTTFHICKQHPKLALCLLPVWKLH